MSKVPLYAPRTSPAARLCGVMFQIFESEAEIAGRAHGGGALQGNLAQKKPPPPLPRTTIGPKA